MLQIATKQVSFKEKYDVIKKSLIHYIIVRNSYTHTISVLYTTIWINQAFRLSHSCIVLFSIIQSYCYLLLPLVSLFRFLLIAVSLAPCT